VPHLLPIFLQRFDKHLTLGGLACPVETFEDYERTSCHLVVWGCEVWQREVNV